MEITEVTSGKKQQHVIIETLLAFKFDDALDKSMVNPTYSDQNS